MTDSSSTSDANTGAASRSHIQAVYLDTTRDAEFYGGHVWKVEYVPAYSHADRWFTTFLEAVTFASKEEQRPALAGSYFAPLPVGPYLESEPAKATQTYGSCSQFCAIGTEAGKRGQGIPVEEHGPWCESVSLGHVTGFNPQGKGWSASASIKDRYMHGEYAPEMLARRRESRYISLELYRGDDDRSEIFLPVGEAFRLAAGVEQLAREADRLNEPLRLAA